jgi:membrane peptidoglycan carboxypeptidase
MALDFLSWVAEVSRDKAPRRSENGRGVVAETTLDPWLQEVAEIVVEGGLAELRRSHRRLKSAELGVALVALDAQSGAVRAYVGGDPAQDSDRFDRARNASRQPGSTVKPLILLEAFERCGNRDPLYPASRVADEPLSVEVPGGPWQPVNPDGLFRGTVTIRQSLVSSLNVPFVRIARYCGLDSTARTFRKTGLELPDEPPPAFTLGAIEVSPLELATAYTALASDGSRRSPLPITRLERPAGRRLDKEVTKTRRVASEATAYLVHDLLVAAVQDGTAHSVAIEGLELAAKTGTSSKSRDAWLAGYGGGLVVVVWVGRDDGESLGLSGSKAAAPIWREMMRRAVPALPPRSRLRPEEIVEKWIHSETGLVVSRGNRHASREIFNRSALPPRDRFWRRDRPIPVVR